MNRLLTKREKESQYLSFIDSEQFGIDTYLTLTFCISNVNYGVQTVDLYWTLIDKINTLKTFDFPKHELNIKQHVALDIIMKTQVMIETFFVLIDALSKGYEHVSKQITHYDSSLPRKIIGQIRSKKYDLYKIIQFPKLQTLDLSSEEKLFLEKSFNSTVNLVWSKLIQFADFYEKYYVVYLKTKHGLSIQTGGLFDTAVGLDFTQSYLSALDHRPKNNLHEDAFTIKQFSNIPTWYNVQSLVKFNSQFKHEILSIVSDLFQVMGLIVESNLTYARNCGQGYLPLQQISENKIALFLLSDKKIPQSESEYMKEIADKVLSSMNTRSLSLKITDEFGEKLQKSFKNDSVTTMYVDD